MASEPLANDPWGGTAAERDFSLIRHLPLPVEIFADIQPQTLGRWLVKHLLMAGSTCVIFGEPGCGKSFLASDLAFHIGSERSWFDRKTMRGGVIYLAAEGQGGFRNRVVAWKQAHGVEDVDFALVPVAVDLLDPKVDVDKVREVLAYFAGIWGGIAMIVVDTLAATFGGGDENGADMSAYVGNVASLCEPYGCARIIVTHAPLIGGAKRPRGHGSLWGSADTVLFVSEGRIQVVKQKDADPGPDIMFKLRQVEIGQDEDGSPVTSCVVEQSELEPGHVRGRRKMSAKEQIVFKALERAVVANGRFPPSEIPDNVLNRARVGKVVAMSEWRAEAMSALAGPDTKPDTARKAFDRARQQLQAAEIIGVWEEWTWLI